MRYDALVLGGGALGLATLEALTRRGLGRPGRIGLVERFGTGHAHGSSHGRSRIARAAYHEPVFARLYRTARDEDWPRLERDAGRTLLHPNPGCVFGPDAEPLARYEAACAAAGAAVERLALADARRAFPALRFADDDGVLRDASACVVAAAETLEALRALALARGAELHESARCTAIERGDSALTVVTERGRFETERLIVTAGAWTGALLPELAGPLTVVRQSVGYFELDAPPEAVRPGAFPVWIRLGAEEGDVHYGLPEFQRPGVKAARHRIVPRTFGGDDPEPVSDTPPEEELAALRDWFAPKLAHPIRAVVGGERCLYTLTPTEDFRLGRLRDEPRITVGAGLSGHGFKFAPLLGRLLSELCLDGTTSVAAFEAERARFAP